MTVKQLCEMITALTEKVNKLYKEVYGNGNSDNAMTTRLARLESSSKITQGLLLLILTAVLGQIFIG